MWLSQIKKCFLFLFTVNVSRSSNFYDLKFIEMRREREAMEQAKRQSGDRVEEFRRVRRFIEFLLQYTFNICIKL